MKLNIQKGLKVVLPLLVVAVMVFGLLPTSAHAASIEAYKATDYVADVVIDGNTKSVIFSFPDIDPLTNVWPQGAGAKEVLSGDYHYYCPTGSYGVASRTYYGGVEAYAYNSAPLTGIFDVSDIMPGAPFTLTMSYEFTFWLDPDHPAVSVTVGHGYFAYDEDGEYLGQFYGEGRVVDFDYGDEMGFAFIQDTDFILADDVHFILPFTSLSLAFDQLAVDDSLSYAVHSHGFSMSTDINMIYEDSETGKQIAEKLDEIIDGPSDVTGDVDEIVGGTADQKDKVEDLIGEMNQMDKPDPGDIDVSIDNIVDASGSEMLASSVGAIARHSLVQSVLLIVGTILVLAYVLFGKKR